MDEDFEMILLLIEERGRYDHKLYIMCILDLINMYDLHGGDQLDWARASRVVAQHYSTWCTLYPLCGVYFNVFIARTQKYITEPIERAWFRSLLLSGLDMKSKYIALKYFN